MVFVGINLSLPLNQFKSSQISVSVSKKHIVVSIKNAPIIWGCISYVLWG